MKCWVLVETDCTTGACFCFAKSVYKERDDAFEAFHKAVNAFKEDIEDYTTEWAHVKEDTSRTSYAYYNCYNDDEPDLFYSLELQLVEVYL